MKFDRRTMNLLLRVLFILLPVAFGLRMYTFWVEIDPITGFFTGRGAGCVTFNAIGIAIFFVCLLLARIVKGDVIVPRKKPKTVPTAKDFEEKELLVRNQELAEEEEDFPEFFLQGVARKSAMWRGTRTAFAHFLPGFFFLFFFLTFFVHAEQLKNPLILVYALLTLLSAVYFLWSAFVNSPEIRKGRAFFALTPAAWYTVRMVVEYRDLVRFVNKAMYAAPFLFLLSAMIFFLYQAQLLLGDPAMDRPNAYIFSALPVIFFGLAERFPYLLAMMSTRVSMDLTDVSCVLMDLGIAFYALIKLRAVLKSES